MGSASALHTKRYRAFLERLRQARLEAGMTQEEAARALGRGQTYVSKCELGERRVDAVEFRDFCKVYGKPPTFFLAGFPGSPRRLR